MRSSFISISNSQRGEFLHPLRSSHYGSTTIICPNRTAGHLPDAVGDAAPVETPAQAADSRRAAPAPGAVCYRQHHWQIHSAHVRLAATADCVRESVMYRLNCSHRRSRLCFTSGSLTTMHTVSVNLYAFGELASEVQRKVVERERFINIEDAYW